MEAPQKQFDELCAKCGEFVASLNDWTGWCDSCSIESGWITPSCISCGKSINGGKLCYQCKREQWLARNADAIERIMATERVSVRKAVGIVQRNNRPICQSCHSPIKGGHKGRHYFCTKRPECIKAHTAYSYHIRNKPHSEALTLAMTASIIYKLTAHINPQPPN